MLKDRKILIQQELTKAKDTAAHMYLTAMVTQSTISTEYAALRERITDLQHDLEMITRLIQAGHP